MLACASPTWESMYQRVAFARPTATCFVYIVCSGLDCMLGPDADKAAWLRKISAAWERKSTFLTPYPQDMKENAESAPWWRLVILDNYGSQANSTDTRATASETVHPMCHSSLNLRCNFVFFVEEACVAIAAPLKLLVSARGRAQSAGTPCRLDIH